MFVGEVEVCRGFGGFQRCELWRVGGLWFGMYSFGGKVGGVLGRCGLWWLLRGFCDVVLTFKP